LKKNFQKNNININLKQIMDVKALKNGFLQVMAQCTHHIQANLTDKKAGQKVMQSIKLLLEMEDRIYIHCALKKTVLVLGIMLRISILDLHKFMLIRINYKLKLEVLMKLQKKYKLYIVLQLKMMEKIKIINNLNLLNDRHIIINIIII